MQWRAPITYKETSVKRTFFTLNHTQGLCISRNQINRQKAGTEAPPMIAPTAKLDTVKRMKFFAETEDSSPEDMRMRITDPTFTVFFFDTMPSVNTASTIIATMALDVTGW